MNRFPDQAGFSAPARVDLAGGTLDLWPLYLLHGRARVVNVAVNRRQQAAVRRIPKGFELRSRDREAAHSFSSVPEAVGRDECRLAAFALDAFGIREGIAVETASAVPYGSGLGGSSALLVALVAAIARVEGRVLEREEMITLCRDVETRVLDAPAGSQDYVPAISGGLNVVTFETGGVRIDRSDLDLAELGRHLVLCDSGASHASGLNNWDVFRARVDGREDVREALEGVRQAGEEMARAVAAGSFEAMGRALADDWASRRLLSDRISTPALEACERAARRAGAWGAKACGAGGGGVLAVLCPSGRREDVQNALREAGGGVLPAGPEAEGLRPEF